MKTYSIPNKNRKPGMSGRWTVLLINGNGKTMTIRWFKGLLFLFLILLGMSVTAAAGFYILFDLSQHEVQYLKNKLAAQNGQPRVPEKKKMQSLPGFLMTESPRADFTLFDDSKNDSKNDPENSGNAGETEDVKDHAVSSADDGVLQSANGAGSEDESKETDEKINENADTDPDATDPGPDEKSVSPDSAPVVIQSEMPRQVDIINFETDHDPRNKTLRVAFEVTNVSQSGDRVSGHVILIMKKNENNPAGWVVLPQMNVTGGRPDGEKQGQSFTISYYKKMRFKLANQPNPDRFRMATVYVFSNNRRLMLEKQFPVKPE